MLIVLYDDNPTKIVPWVTYLLIALCIIVFGFELFLPQSKVELVVGLVHADPSHFYTVNLAQHYIGPLSAITHTFLHIDIFHLAGNMLYLYVFGNNVEEVFGRWKFLIFYFICGTISIVAQFYFDHVSSVIGASGAISGVLGGYALLFPHVKMYVSLYKFFIIPISCKWWVAIWLVFQYLGLFVLGDNSIAYMAHLGGFAAGVILTPFFKKPEFELFSTRGEHS